ncbi:hypothetical protein D3C76_1534290 [compost metagenome]
MHGIIAVHHGFVSQRLVNQAAESVIGGAGNRVACIDFPHITPQAIIEILMLGIRLTRQVETLYLGRLLEQVQPSGGLAQAQRAIGRLAPTGLGG